MTGSLRAVNTVANCFYSACRSAMQPAQQFPNPSCMIGKPPDVLPSMKTFLAVLLAGLAICPWPARAIPESSGEPTVKPLAKDIDTLVSNLADENFRVREKATSAIWELGEVALPALRDAIKAGDPEQVFRARELIRKIQLHITPDTDPAVIALVERYGTASPTEKTALFAAMREKRAWRQMLKLFAAETRADVRAKLQPAINGIAIRAARERIYQGAERDARELLEMAPADNASLLALAEFHRSHGTLDDELKRAGEVKGRKSETWQLALQRAAGNVAAARDAANAVGETRIAAAMAALAGDPLPWLQTPPDRDEEAASDPVATAYATIAGKRWQGAKIRPSDLEQLSRRLTSRTPQERIAVMNALFLLGETGPAETAFVKSAPLAAFRYFEALERIPEALAALDLDPQRPDYKNWVEKHLAKYTANDIEDQREPSQEGESLVALANFLERRGLNDVTAAEFDEPLAALAKKDANTFTDLLGKFFGNQSSLSGAPQLARRVGAAWAGDDDKRWDEIVMAAVGDDEPTKEWWDWLAELDPKASRPERLDAMLALWGLGADPAKLRDKWLALAWTGVAAAPANRRDSLVARISALALQTGDVSNSLKAWDKLPAEGRKEIFWGEHILHLSAAGRWNEAAEVFLQQIAAAKQLNQEPSVQFHAYAAAALRQAGRLQEAATHDQWADQLALGNATISIQIGNGYAFGHDYQRAAEWWARAVRQADPATGEFAIAMKLHADVLLEDANWQETAAISEVLCRIYSTADFRSNNPLPLMHQRLTADMARALANLKTDRAGSLAILAKCHQQFASDGSLADFFFPALRKVGLLKEHDEWFRETWTLLEKVIASYPQSDNTRNTAAWFAARALRQLDAAEQHLIKALVINPNQSAYLDTMAELQFAKGNREQALKWSEQAVNFLPDDAQLRRQQERFRSEPLPK